MSCLLVKRVAASIFTGLIVAGSVSFPVNAEYEDVMTNEIVFDTVTYTESEYVPSDSAEMECVIFKKRRLMEKNCKRRLLIIKILLQEGNSSSQWVMFRGKIGDFAGKV